MVLAAEYDGKAWRAETEEWLGSRLERAISAGLPAVAQQNDQVPLTAARVDDGAMV
jgi:hypothetical protein